MTFCPWLRHAVTAACAVALSVGSISPAVAGHVVPAQSVTRSALQQKSGDYVPITDKSGVLSLEVPESWSDIEETEWAMDNDSVGAKLTAAPDLEDFYASWGVPGVVVSYSESLPEEMTVEELLDTIDYSESCTESEDYELPDGDLIGLYRIWGNCDDTTTAAIVVLTPADAPDYYVLLEIYAVAEEDLDALEHIIATLRVGGGSQADEPVVTTTDDSSLLESIDTSDLVYTYVELRDRAVVAVIPQEYAETEAAVWENSKGDALGYTLTAAPDLQKFHDSWTTPGMIIKSATGLDELLDADELLADDDLAEVCTYDDRYTDEREVDGVTYLVDYDWYDKCGKTKSAYVVGLAQTDPPDIALFFDFLLVDDADVEALDVFLNTFSVDAELADAAPAATPVDDEPGVDDTQGPLFADVTDDSGTISLRVPASWTDTLSEDWDLGDGPIGASFYAAPDIAGYNDTWDVPGIFVGVSEKVAESFTPDEVLDVFDFSDNCTYDDRYDYESSNLEGVYDVWTGCGGVEEGTFVVLAATPVDEESPLLLLNINMPAEDDAAAFSEIVNTVAIAGAVTSVEETQQETLLNEPLAVVKVDSLNIRSGPGTNYNRVGLARQGDTLIIEGQIDSCSWLKITTVDGVAGWASGKNQYVTLDTRCTDIPPASRPAPPPATAPTGGETGGARSGQGASQGSATPDNQTGSASEGCYLFQNQLGAELTITFTRSDTGKGTTFKVAGNGESEKCFDAGRYTYTIDAPPPWNSINGELTVQAGDAFLFPISGE